MIFLQSWNSCSGYILERYLGNGGGANQEGLMGPGFMRP